MALRAAQSYFTESDNREETVTQRRFPTKAWVVLADEKGPIEGFELLALRRWEGTIRDEPIFHGLFSSVIPPYAPIEFDLHLYNEGPFIRYFPRPDDERSWTPDDRPAIEPPVKEIEK